MVRIFPTQLAIKRLFSFPPHPMYASIQITSVTDGQTNGRTDRQTDRRPDDG